MFLKKDVSPSLSARSDSNVYVIARHVHHILETDTPT